MCDIGSHLQWKEAVRRYREQQDALVEEKSREISMLIENKNKEVERQTLGIS